MDLKSMSGREKFIVGIAGLAVLYGIYEFVVLSRRTPTPTTAEVAEAVAIPGELSFYIKNISHAMLQIELSPFEKAIIDNLDAEWKAENPFRREAPPPEKVDPLPVYSGFMAMGNRRLAVLDGMEYEEGDMLPQKGYRVTRIDPGYVVLTGENAKTAVVHLETSTRN